MERVVSAQHSGRFFHFGSTLGLRLSLGVRNFARGWKAFTDSRGLERGFRWGGPSGAAAVGSTGCLIQRVQDQGLWRCPGVTLQDSCKRALEVSLCLRLRGLQYFQSCFVCVFGPLGIG